MKQNLKRAVNLTALVLAAGLLMGLLTGCTSTAGGSTASEPTNPDIFTTDGSGTIKGYTCDKKDLPKALVIPGKIKNEVITKIGEKAFWGCTDLTEVKLPASLTEIGWGAFSGCTGLTSLDLSGCTSLTKIDENAFADCKGLTSISMPASLTEIDGAAFAGCTGLIGVKLPVSLTEIAPSAFSGCTGLTSLTIDSTNTKYKTKDNILYNKEGSTLVFAAGGLTSVEIPKTVTEISNEAFSGCMVLTEVKLPANLAEIGSYAFIYCTGLTSAVFADPNGWEAGSTPINPSGLADPATAAKYLRETYVTSNWKKN